MRILAVDFGLERIGLAVSDPTATIAYPYGHIAERDKGRQTARVIEVVGELSAQRVVVGMPYELDGAVGPMAQIAEKFAAKLERVLDVPVVRWDERFTSVEADELLRDLPRKRGKRRERGDRDAMAACVLLRDYLDAGCPAP